jgi:hypothetical protein
MHVKISVLQIKVPRLILVSVPWAETHFLMFQQEQEIYGAANNNSLLIRLCYMALRGKLIV